MQDPPQVSVVIPTCDRRHVLARCLDSLTNQTHGSFEVIVVDDGSEDDTPDFLQAFVDEHASHRTGDHAKMRFRWLRNERRTGANPSRNRGIREAMGEFVALLDCDCIAEPDWLDRLLEGFTNPNVAAVTGLVRDPPPTNLYELTFKGTHRIHGSQNAHRLVAGNMCVRSSVLREHALDEDRAKVDSDITVSGRGDEEGLFLILRAAGYEVRVAPEAVVLHEHGFTGRRFFRQAYRGGKSAARLVYKFRLAQRLDMLPFVLAYASLPLMLVDVRLAIVPGLFFAAALAAITYNDLFRKGKTIGETVRSFPVLLVYYQVRLCGYAVETIRLRLGRHDIRRVRLDKAPVAGQE